MRKPTAIEFLKSQKRTLLEEVESGLDMAHIFGESWLFPVWSSKTKQNNTNVHEIPHLSSIHLRNDNSRNQLTAKPNTDHRRFIADQTGQILLGSRPLLCTSLKTCLSGLACSDFGTSSNKDCFQRSTWRKFLHFYRPLYLLQSCHKLAR